MIPVFSQKGTVIAWMKEGALYGIKGEPEAFLSGENVITYAGRHCGIFRDNFFRDHAGDVTGFLNGAHGGPKLPPPQIPPPAPMAGTAPMKPDSPMPPAQHIPTFAWSALAWDGFIGRQPQQQNQRFQPPPPPPGPRPL